MTTYNQIRGHRKAQRMAALQWSSILLVVTAFSVAATRNNYRENGSLMHSAPLIAQGGLVPPVPNLWRTAYKPLGCVIKIDDAEADTLTKMLRGLMSIFTQKSEPVRSVTEIGTEIRHSCDSGVSNVKASIWFILNRLWLATSCQYPEEEALQQALRQVEQESIKVSRILRNVDVLSPNGSVHVEVYANTVYELEQVLDNAVKTMTRVHKARQCNSLNVKQVTDVFEIGIQEITSLKKILEVQRKETREALEALAEQREETKKVLQLLAVQREENRKSLEEVELQKGEAAKVLVICAKQKFEMEDALKTLRGLSERSDQDRADLAELKRRAETVQAEVKEVTLKNERRLDRLEKYSFISFNENIVSWSSAIQTGRTNDLISLTENPLTQAILEENMQLILSKAYSNDANNMDAVLNFVAKLPEKFSTSARHSLIFSQSQVMEWAVMKIQGGKGEDIIGVTENFKAFPFVLESEIPKLVTASYANNTGNIDAILAFMDKLPTPSLALSAYQTLFTTMNHIKDGKESVRLINKMHEHSLKFHENPEKSEPSFRSFLTDNVHPKFLKLIAGEFFNLDAMYGDPRAYVYLYANPTNANILDNAAWLRNVKAEERKQAKWLWQIVPVPGEDGKIFYIRNKLNANKPVLATSKLDENYLQIIPQTEYPVVRQPGADFSSRLIFFMWSVKHNTHYHAKGASFSSGQKLGVTGTNLWHWEAVFS